MTTGILLEVHTNANVTFIIKCMVISFMDKENDRDRSLDFESLTTFSYQVDHIFKWKVSVLYLY